MHFAFKMISECLTNDPQYHKIVRPEVDIITEGGGGDVLMITQAIVIGISDR